MKVSIGETKVMVSGSGEVTTSKIDTCGICGKE